MKRIDDYFVEDDFEYETHEFSGVPFYVYKGCIYAGASQKSTMIWQNAIARVCECGSSTSDKGWMLCPECRHKKEATTFNDMLIEPYTKGQIYSAQYDEYFEDFYDYIYGKMCDMELEELLAFKIEDLKLQPCQECHPQELYISDLCEDSHEDFDVNSMNPEIFELEKRLNKLLKYEVIAIQPRNRRLEITKDMIEVFENAKDAELKDRDEEMRNNI